MYTYAIISPTTAIFYLEDRAMFEVYAEYDLEQICEDICDGLNIL